MTGGDEGSLYAIDITTYETELFMSTLAVWLRPYGLEPHFFNVRFIEFDSDFSF